MSKPATEAQKEYLREAREEIDHLLAENERLRAELRRKDERIRELEAEAGLMRLVLRTDRDCFLRLKRSGVWPSYPFDDAIKDIDKVLRHDAGRKMASVIDKILDALSDLKDLQGGSGDE